MLEEFEFPKHMPRGCMRRVNETEKTGLRSLWGGSGYPAHPDQTHRFVLRPMLPYLS
jgi:hypothetical protein